MEEENLCTHSLLQVETNAFTQDVGDAFKL